MSKRFGILIVFLLFPCTGLADEPVAGTPAEDTEVLDYSVCIECDVHSADDPEVRNFAEMIASARWDMSQVEHGLMLMRDHRGNERQWRWKSDEGTLGTLTHADEEAPAASTDR